MKNTQTLTDYLEDLSLKILTLKNIIEFEEIILLDLNSEDRVLNRRLRALENISSVLVSYLSQIDEKLEEQIRKV